MVRPDNTYEVKIDNGRVESGSLEEDWDLLPPRKIKDPDAHKPDDWDERAKIDDPEDTKPEVRGGGGLQGLWGELWGEWGQCLDPAWPPRTGTSPSTSLTPMPRSQRTGMRRWMGNGSLLSSRTLSTR